MVAPLNILSTAYFFPTLFPQATISICKFDLSPIYEFCAHHMKILLISPHFYISSMIFFLMVPWYVPIFLFHISFRGNWFLTAILPAFHAINLQVVLHFDFFHCVEVVYLVLLFSFDMFCAFPLLVAFLYMIF